MSIRDDWIKAGEPLPNTDPGGYRLRSLAALHNPEDTSEAERLRAAGVPLSPRARMQLGYADTAREAAETINHQNRK